MGAEVGQVLAPPLGLQLGDGAAALSEVLQNAATAAGSEVDVGHCGGTISGSRTHLSARHRTGSAALEQAEQEPGSAGLPVDILDRAAGHDCAHVYELGLGGQPDEQIMALADREDRILISADTDFGELLANAPVLAPSVILLRRADKRAGSLAAVVLANLEQVADDLAAGTLIVISDTRIRVRRLPMKPSYWGPYGTEPSGHIACMRAIAVRAI